MIKTLYEIFQHWSAKGSVYLLSDLHLDDDDCLLMDPDWIPPEEQIWIINNKVTRNDTFICLGDVGSSDYAAQKSFFWAIMTGGKTIRTSLMRFMKDRCLYLRRSFSPMNRSMAFPGV